MEMRLLISMMLSLWILLSGLTLTWMALVITQMTMTMECQTIARACGKSHVHNLEPEDLAALTMESAAMAKIPLAGTDWIPGNAI